MHSRLWSLLLVPLLLGAGQPIDPRTLAWDSSGGPEIVAGYEVVQGWNGAEIRSTVTALSVPLAARTGTAYAARVRALPVDPVAHDPSPWTTIVLEWPGVLPQITSLSQLGRNTAPLPGGGPVMAAPTFVAEYPTAFNSATSPKTAMNAVAINSSDVLVAIASSENEDRQLSITENGAGSAALVQSNTVAAYATTYGWTYVAPNAETITITFTATGNDVLYFGGNVVRFSGSSGIGASNKASGVTESPSVSLTTTQDNSAIVAICGDWYAISGTQTFTLGGSSAGWSALTDYPGDAAVYGVAIAYIGDAGAAGEKTVAMSAPTGQKWSIIVVEVKGTAGAAATALPRRALDGPFYGALRGSVR